MDGRHVGEVLSIPESRLAHGQWSGVHASRADLEELFLRNLLASEPVVSGRPL